MKSINNQKRIISLFSFLFTAVVIASCATTSSSGEYLMPEKNVKAQQFKEWRVDTKIKTGVPLKELHVPDDLVVTVWAKSPYIKNPTNMDIDAKGRIWVAEGVNYRRHHGRNIVPTGLNPKGDRIMVLQDKDQDGVADSSHIFVQDKELVAPLGIAVIGNKIIVAQPPNMIVYTDVDGDLKFNPKIDKKENLVTGFGGWNHDHSLHALTFGPDGNYYFNHGNAGTGVIKDKSGKTITTGSGYDDSGSISKKIEGYKANRGVVNADGHVYPGGTAYRIKPDGTGLEVIGGNFRNSYEQAINSFGDVYNNDNDDHSSCRTTWLMEYGNLGFFSADALRSWQLDKRPGMASGKGHWRQEDPGTIPSGDVYGGGAPTGIVFYENGALGKGYEGTLFSCEAARNIVFRYKPKANGAGFDLENNYKEVNGKEDRYLITSNPVKDYAGNDFKHKGMGKRINTMFRPSDISVGPDGAIYVCDWFDDRVGGHTALDKNYSGTIYRIAPKGFKVKIPVINMDTVEGQIAALKNPAINVRGLAFAALVKSGNDAIPALKNLLKDDNKYIAARAIWILAKIGRKGIREIEPLLKTGSDQVKVCTFRALRRVGAHKGHLMSAASDKSTPLRREVALSLRGSSYKESSAILLKIAENYKKSDRWYLEALGTASFGNEEKLYNLFASKLGNKNPLKWTKTFADISWRFHTDAALDGLYARAKNPAFNEAERRRMTTAIAFNPSKKAVDYMVSLSNMTFAGDKHRVAGFFLVRPQVIAWTKISPVKENTQPMKDVTRDYVVPVTLGKAPSKLPSAKEILKLKGDAKKGKALMAANCIMCHSSKALGGGGDFGPDLSTYASTQSTEVLTNAILNPSSDLAHGYHGYDIEMKNGKKVQGFLVLQERRSVTVKTFGGKVITINSRQIKSKKDHKGSLMMSASQLGLKAQELRDIVQYMKTSSSN